MQKWLLKSTIPLRYANLMSWYILLLIAYWVCMCKYTFKWDLITYKCILEHCFTWFKQICNCCVLGHLSCAAVLIFSESNLKVYTLEFCVYNIIYEGVEMAFQNYIVIQVSVKMPGEWWVHIVKGIIKVQVCKQCHFSGLQALLLLKLWALWNKQTHKHCWIPSPPPLHYIDTNLVFDGTQGLLLQNFCQTYYECKSYKTKLDNL
jgi:hypothetical protein